MTLPNNAAGSTPGVDAGAAQTPPAPPAAPTGDQPDYKALYEELKAKQSANPPAPTPAKGTGTPDPENEWFKRAVGFQQSAQAEAKARADAEAALKARNDEYAALNDLFKNKETEVSALKVKEAELDIVQGSLERLNIIASEYPDLLKFLGKDEDLLPDGRGDDLRTKLTSFQARLGNPAAPVTPKTPAGATPTPPTGAGGDSYASFMQEALNALARGDQTAYDLNYQKALAASK